MAKMVHVHPDFLAGLQEAHGRLRAENAELKQRNADWLKENGPGGWIDNMRQRITELEALLQEAWADHIRLPYGASHEDVTTFRDFEKRFRALSGGGGS